MHRIAAIFLLPFLLLTATVSAQGTLGEDLERLDRTLEMAGDFVANHEAKTAALRSLLDTRDLSPAEAFDLYGQLFRAEFTYRFDNAKEAADRRAEAAAALKDRAKVSEANVDRAMLFCVAGMYLEAMQASTQIDTSCLSGQQLIQYYNFQQRFLNRERKLMTVLSCPKCGILKQGVPEDLDEFAEEILNDM